MAEHLRANGHTCQNVVLKDTYLGYEPDYLIEKKGQWTLKPEEWDFFILRFWSVDKIRKLAKLGIINSNNCIIKFHGSDCRYNDYAWRGTWEDFNLTYVSNGYDYYMTRGLGFAVQHIPQLIDTKKLWALRVNTKLQLDTFKIGHAPTNTKIKKTEEFKRAIEMVKETGRKVEGVVITSTKYEDTIRTKAQCHAIYDQMNADIGIGGFGVNLLEALAMSQPAFGHFVKYVYSMYPQLNDLVYNPQPANAEGLAEQIMNVYDELFETGKLALRNHNANPAGMAFVRDRFDVSVVGKQWQYLIEHVAEGNVTRQFNWEP